LNFGRVKFSTKKIKIQSKIKKKKLINKLQTQGLLISMYLFFSFYFFSIYILISLSVATRVFLCLGSPSFIVNPFLCRAERVEIHKLLVLNLKSQHSSYKSKLIKLSLRKRARAFGPFMLWLICYYHYTTHPSSLAISAVSKEFINNQFISSNLSVLQILF
jgi:hypothetical protein